MRRNKAFQSLHISFLVGFVLLSAAPVANAATPPRSKAVIAPAAQDLWIIRGANGRNVSCALFRNRNLVVRPQKGKYVNVTIRLSELKKLLAKSKSYSKKAVSAAKKEQSDLKKIQRNGARCALGKPAASTPVATPVPTPVATPVPAEFSMSAFSGPVNAETMRYLLEKAAYGLSSNEQPVVDLGLSQGIPPAVNELLRIKEEDRTLANRLQDRLNASNNVGGGSGLGDLSTQTRDSYTYPGMRRAALDYAINTKNPLRENLRHFLLGLWTVGHDVLSNNPAGNPQRVLWQNYFQLLGDIAYDRPLPEQFRGELAGKPKFPAWLVVLQRDPMMLLFASNNQNVKGNPNENYARELMELFSLGVKRVDPASNELLDNYVEERGGKRTLGDIYRAARVLTGWRVSPFQDGQGIMQWRSVFSAADHDTAVQPMFEGEAHAFDASSDADLVFGIFEKHPSGSSFIAKELLRWYVTANPPEDLVRSFAQVLKTNNFDLISSLTTLFNSEAFYHPNYHNTVIKNAFKVGVELTRCLELSRRGLSSTASLAQEVGVNIAAREGTPDNEGVNAYTRGSIAAMGYTTTLPADGVFFFPDANWIRPTSLMETANFAAALLASSNTELGRLVDDQNRGWLPQRVLPEGRRTVDDVINHVAGRLGITLSVDDLAQLRFYMENSYSPGRRVNGVLSEYVPFSYDNRFNGIPSTINGFSTANHQRDKAQWLYAILAMNPQFLLG